MKLEMAGPEIAEMPEPGWPDDRLVKCCPRVGHISMTCKNHPELRWSGKNIPGRSLFFFGMAPGHGWVAEDGHENQLLTRDMKVARECDCPAADLVHIHEVKA